MYIHADIVIIGGGAAGFFTAINCAEANPNYRIILIERAKKVLAKVKISGGGRCNVTHACFEPRELIKYYPRGDKALLGPFHRFCTGDTIAWFEDRGVPTKIEADGRMFPKSNTSQSIVDCLWQSAQKAGVEIHTQTRLKDLMPLKNEEFLWQINTNKQTYKATKIMVATGSNPSVWKHLARLGHTIVPPVPSLFTFNIKHPCIDGLLGLSVPNAQIKVTGEKLVANGPLLITHWGLSGPAILKLSAWGARVLHQHHYQFNIQVNWLYPNKAEEIKMELLKYKQEQPKKQVYRRAHFGLPLRLWKSMLTTANIPPQKRWADVSKKEMQAFTQVLTNLSFKVKGKSTFKEEFVTAGGVDLKEVNFKTFESKKLKGLYFAGEVLNIDAITGGFNFQAAWTGGWIAAESMGNVNG